MYIGWKNVRRNLVAIVTRDRIYNTSNVPMIRPLLLEEGGNNAVFTTSKDHKDGYISLYKLFVQFVVDDPTETVFADEVFGDVAYWYNVRETSTLRGHLEEWREICDVLRKKKAFEAILNEVKSKGRNSFQASKYLIEEPWKKGSPNRRKVRQTTEEAFNQSVLKEDLERIRAN